jgi:hypothetical protein
MLDAELMVIATAFNLARKHAADPASVHTEDIHYIRQMAETVQFTATLSGEPKVDGPTANNNTRTKMELRCGNKLVTDFTAFISLIARNDPTTMAKIDSTIIGLHVLSQPPALDELIATAKHIKRCGLVTIQSVGTKNLGMRTTISDKFRLDDVQEQHNFCESMSTTLQHQITRGLFDRDDFSEFPFSKHNCFMVDQGLNIIPVKPDSCFVINKAGGGRQAKAMLEEMQFVSDLAKEKMREIMEVVEQFDDYVNPEVHDSNEEADTPYSLFPNAHSRQLHP